MTSLLRRIFIDNWARKIISLILATVVYFVIAQSLTTTKTVDKVAVRVINIPEDKAVEGLTSNGLLDRKIDLQVTGHKKTLETLSGADIVVVIDAQRQSGEWIPKISPKNIKALKPNLNVNKSIRRISHKGFIVKLADLVTDKIQVIITNPTGTSPDGYSFLDGWPYRLFVTVKGPHNVVENLRKTGLKRTFDLSEITKANLNALETKKDHKDDVVSFYVPDHWKEILVPTLSDIPLKIDDPSAKHLRIDFVRHNLLPINVPVPVDLYFFPKTASELNPQTAKLGVNTDIIVKDGIKMFSKPLYTKGVSRNFLKIVKDYIEVIVMTTPVAEGQSMKWTPHIVNAKELEDSYVSLMLADAINFELSTLHPEAREEYLRNRFRSYLNRFQLYTQDGKPLELFISCKGNQIIVDKQ